MICWAEAGITARALELRGAAKANVPAKRTATAEKDLIIGIPASLDGRRSGMCALQV
jgi:predicted oxidoreductase